MEHTKCQHPGYAQILIGTNVPVSMTCNHCGGWRLWDGSKWEPWTLPYQALQYDSLVQALNEVHAVIDQWLTSAALHGNALDLFIGKAKHARNTVETALAKEK